MTVDDDGGARQNGGGRPAAACVAAGEFLRRCPHVPACPPPQAPGRQAARVVVSHPEQGWSLLCNGVVAFEDTGALLPDGSAIEPDRTTRQAGSTGITQAGHGRTAPPMPAGRAGEGGLLRPGPVMAGAALGTSPPGAVAGSRQHAARLRRWRVLAQVMPPAYGRQERMAADAW